MTNKLITKKFEYCKICKRKLAKWVLSPDGDGGFNTSLQDEGTSRYNIYKGDNVNFEFICYSCE